MPFRERFRQLVQTFSIEVLSLWFVFLDRRVRWFIKVFLLIPIAYVVSPFDILQDTVLGWGQIDDLAILRMSHFLFSRFLAPEVMADSRRQAAAFLDAGPTHRAAFFLAVAAVWGITILLVLRWFVKRFVSAL